MEATRFINQSSKWASSRLERPNSESYRSRVLILLYGEGCPAMDASVMGATGFLPIRTSSSRASRSASPSKVWESAKMLE